MRSDFRSVSYREPFVRACTARARADPGGFLDDLDAVLRDVVAPAAKTTDETGAYPKAALEALASVGAPAVQVPREFGGLGLGTEIAALTVERTARVCASTAAILLFHFQVVQRTLGHAHRARRAGDLAMFAGGTLGASAWTESTGRPKDAPQTVFTGSAIQGTKTFCTGLPSAGLIDVLLTASGGAGPTFVRVEAARPGISVAEIYPMLGLRGSGTGTLRLDQVLVRDTDVLGGLGTARELMRDNHCTPLNPGLIALGIASAAYDTARGICAGEVDGVPPRYARPSVRAAIAETAVRVEQTYVYAAHLIEEIAATPQTAHVPSSKLKLLATATAEDVTRQLMSSVGSSGFLSSFPLERLFRDAHATALMGPASELCLARVAESVLPDA